MPRGIVDLHITARKVNTTTSRRRIENRNETKRKEKRKLDLLVE
jgi:hypothetical protein